MANEWFEGNGDSQKAADKSLESIAKKAGFTKQQEIEYSVQLTVEGETYNGVKSADFGHAYATALEEAKVSATEVQKDMLSVTARGLYGEKSTAKPRASGAAPSAYNTTKVTDLF